MQIYRRPRRSPMTDSDAAEESRTALVGGWRSTEKSSSETSASLRSRSRLTLRSMRSPSATTLTGRCTASARPMEAAVVTVTYIIYRYR